MRKGPEHLINVAPMVSQWMRWEPNISRSDRVEAISECLYAYYPAEVKSAIIKMSHQPILTDRENMSNVRRWVDDSFDKVCSLLLSQEDSREMMIETINMQKGRNFRLDHMNSLPMSQSILRKQDGSLRKSSGISKLLTNGTNINAVLLTISKNSDYDAYEELKKNRSIKSYMTSQNLISYAGFAKQEVSKDFISYLVSGLRPSADPITFEMKLGEWLGVSIGGVALGAWKTIKPIYRKDFAKTAGHEILHAMFKRENTAREGDDVLVQKLVEDGADWYIALQQYREGGYVYLGLVDRTPAPLAEITELIEAGGRLQAAPVVELILRALPQERVLAYVTDTKQADRVFKIAKLPYLRDYVSERVLAKNLEVDLGL
jgi:hypothetical protein